MTQTSALALRALLVALVTLIALPLAPASAYDDETPPQDRTTVGIRTATSAGGDDRGRYEHQIARGGEVLDWVAVSNHGLKPVTVNLLALDADSQADSGFVVPESTVKPTALGSWIRLDKRKLRLAPRSETLVPFRIRVPRGATPGDHAAALVLSLMVRQRSAPDQAGVLVEHRIATRVYVRVPGELEPALEITDLEATWGGAWKLSGKGPLEVTYTVRNTGNVRLGANHSLELSGRMVEASWSDDVDEILPGGELLVKQTFSEVTGLGPIHVTARLRPMALDDEVNRLDELPAGTGEVTVDAWPWLQLLSCLGLLLLLLFSIASWRWRRRRRARAVRPAPEEEAKMPALLRTLLATGAIAIVALLGVVPGAAHADDHPVWRADLNKKSGVATEPIDLVTSGGCPVPATSIVGRAFGPGFPKDGGVIISNTQAGVSAEGAFMAYLSDSMANLMSGQPNAKPLDGVYRLVVSCIRAEDPYSSLGDYVAQVEFDGKGHFKAMPPLTQKRGPVLPGGPESIPTKASDANPKAGQGKGSDGKTGPRAAGDPSDGTSGAGATPTQSPEERAAELNGVTDVAADDSGAASVSWPLILAGLAVLAGVALLLFRDRIAGLRRTNQS